MTRDTYKVDGGHMTKRGGGLGVQVHLVWVQIVHAQRALVR